MADVHIQPKALLVDQSTQHPRSGAVGIKFLHLCLVMVLIVSTLMAGVQPVTGQSSTLRADALVIVNTTSGAYVHYEQWIKPYLDHFGIPYTIWDIATTPAVPDLESFAVIIIGHDQLDYMETYLSQTIQAQISLAVSEGTGLVNFDFDLAGGDFTPYYHYIQDIFNFTYYDAAPADIVSFNSSPALGGYITALQPLPISYTLRFPTILRGLNPDTGSATLASLGTDPLVVVDTYGLGRAVQWTTINWMGSGNLGPVSGMDDLVWRSIVWAARKPFVMQGMPPFVTFRIDDVVGPYTWVNTAVSHDFKPWVGIFMDTVTEIPTLKTLVDSGNVTASIHARSYNSSFYFDHLSGTDWPDAVMQQNYLDGTEWHTLHQIPISKVVVPHFYEIGTNAFEGLSDWGVEFILTPMLPGNPYGADRLLVGPFFEYSNPCGSGCGLPFYFADILPIPNHPEYDGDFHVVITEIRDIGGYEWFPSDEPGYLQDTIDRGVAQLKRALDGMELATIFTHEEFILSITDENWDTIMAGVAAGVASYQPEYVTLDYASQYVRATLTSQISSSIYNPLTGNLDTTLTGSTDMPTRFYLFTETAGNIFSQFVDVPTFSGSTLVSTAFSGGLPHTISGNAGVAGATLNYTGGVPVTADGTGAYSLTVPYGWSGSVTPTRPGSTFTPASRSYVNATTDFTAQNYTANPVTYTISGNAGVAGATLNFTGGTPVTADGSGNYSLTVPYNWSGSVTPSLSAYVFSPPSRSYTNLLASQSEQDFLASNTTTISIPLLAGWNMVSINIHPLSTAATDVLASLEGNYDLVYAWDASLTSNNWLRADNIPFSEDNLTHIDETTGLWIHLTAPDTLEVTGTYPVSTTIPLSVAGGGWNLVGYPSGSTADPASVLSSNTTLVFSYRLSDAADPWKLFDVTSPPITNDLTEMMPTWGYWIQVSADQSWTVNY